MEKIMKKMFITVSNQGNAGKSTISNICIDYLRNVLKVPCAVYLADSGAEQDRVLVMHGKKGAKNQNALTGVKVIDLLCKNSQTEIESEKRFMLMKSNKSSLRKSWTCLMIAISLLIYLS
jgi:hypothetical protein